MTDVDRLLRQYIEQFESGGSPNPTEFLDHAQDRDRARLSALIEGYLETEAPAREWDADAFEGSMAERAVAGVAESWSTASGQLPSELVARRKEARIKRGDLVTRLAKALGVPDRREKVALYYHQLERGLLPAGGVSSRVFDALAKLLGTTAGELREAGGSISPAFDQASPGIAATHARTARHDPIYAQDADLAAPAPAARPASEQDQEPDEVDRLFTGGD